MINNGSIDLSVQLGKSRLKNPVMPASGTFGYGREFSSFIDLERLGAIVVKSITPGPRLGSFEHRFIELAGGSFLSNIGLQNVGIEIFIKEKLPYLRQFETPLIVSIAGESIEEFIRLAERLNKAGGVSALQLNLTCPNTARGGMMFSADPELTFSVVKAVRGVTGLTLIPKLLPTTTDITTLGRVCEEAGADAIRPSAGRVGMAIDINTRRSKLGKNLTGALGGPALKSVAVRMVWQVSQLVGIPVIGCGGITSAEDALEFLIAGATAIEIGTYNLIDPKATLKTIEGIERYLIDHRISRIRDIIGSMIFS
ncbi:MAG: dihydroorotate dehydrogenase B catalytic subunit [Deltaproteobacteria bacterium RBG_13_47_9]|nr:MAG: dihydroorotate dehydrogenase B catalytic subunit [Deltaproteobacteria bacterium RBG_13_47_9]